MPRSDGPPEGVLTRSRFDSQTQRTRPKRSRRTSQRSANPGANRTTPYSSWTHSSCCRGLGCCQWRWSRTGGRHGAASTTARCHWAAPSQKVLEPEHEDRNSATTGNCKLTKACCKIHACQCRGRHWQSAITVAVQVRRRVLQPPPDLHLRHQLRPL